MTATEKGACIFCRIVAGDLGCDKLYEDDGQRT